MDDSYIYVIVALLPLAAVILTIQVDPYKALVVRGILGAIAALVYAVLGAADVALTEALVGTMLAIALYAIAVRSSLVMRIGVLDRELSQTKDADTFADLRTIAKKYHLRLELLPYPDPESLQQALMAKEVHATCKERSPTDLQDFEPEGQRYHTTIRIRRLHNILQTELTLPATCLTYTPVPDLGDEH
ncbi:DUF4040 domain-containing protein [Aliterella atlantica]|uniref:MrpA C-terminal/MbhD domain-containing protein n=1 Tax=Aliterella atlantica CENA595 TaxID=1618023 RepID=A0A0D8ZXU6_9CYAN|nr:DUF4040 domain-containing protein [Aliterella atlantica]KJH73603.1 hypothetical protein UH38_02270 [Aliterella atlantica CENA595]